MLWCITFDVVAYATSTTDTTLSGFFFFPLYLLAISLQQSYYYAAATNVNFILSGSPFENKIY